MPTFFDLISYSKESLGDTEVVHSDTLALLCDIFSKSKASLLADLNLEIEDDELISRFYRAIERLKDNEPLAYILGWTQFSGLRFKVGPGVLIPRLETEFLVERAAALIMRHDISTVLELGLGSGCISISLAKRFPHLTFIGIEQSSTAFKYAMENSDAHSCSNLHVILGDFFDVDVQQHVRDLINSSVSFGKHGGAREQLLALEPSKPGLDCSASANLPLNALLISNPPYIPQHDCTELELSVRDFEPVAALDGGMDGLDYYRRMWAWLQGQMSRSGLCDGLKGDVSKDSPTPTVNWQWAFEFGVGQSSDLKTIAREFGFKNVGIDTDFSGKDRVIFSGM
jgi:release factor glutamine methyltransferase